MVNLVSDVADQTKPQPQSIIQDTASFNLALIPIVRNRDRHILEAELIAELTATNPIMASTSYVYVLVIALFSLVNNECCYASRSLLQANPTLPQPQIPTIPTLPQPQMPTIPQLPQPQMPTIPSLPIIPTLPNMPKVSLPPLPSMPTMPTIPNLPTALSNIPFFAPPPSNKLFQHMGFVAWSEPCILALTNPTVPQPQIPTIPSLPQPQIPTIPTLPQPQMPTIPQLPQPQMPTIPTLPTMPKVSLPPLPSMPKIPNFPTTLPNIPFFAPPPSNK
ncbi:hypothetical protein LXL04_022054 [Taraxacum kok-saghyz]